MRKLKSLILTKECLLTNKYTGFIFLCNNERVLCFVEKKLKDKDVNISGIIYFGLFKKNNEQLDCCC
jgi:hypothetical protein